MKTTFKLSNGTSIFLDKVEAINKRTQQIQYVGNTMSISENDAFKELCKDVKDYHLAKVSLTADGYKETVIEDLQQFIITMKEQIEETATSTVITAIKNTIGQEVHELNTLNSKFQTLMENIAKQFDNVNDDLSESIKILDKNLYQLNHNSGKVDSLSKDLETYRQQLEKLLKTLGVLIKED